MVRIFIYTFTYCLLLVSGSLAAQKLYGNEWIVPSQTYLKIPVAQTGFYQITGKELEAARIPIADISSSSIQMFRRGKEITMEVNSKEKLSKESIVTFYGERNDGSGDSSLYISPDLMPHSYYSLYSDTAAYFLTWRVDSGIGKRLDSTSQNPTDTLPYHFEKSLQLFTSHYLPGKFYPPGSNFDNGSVLSDYDVGEGWTGPEILENQSFEISFKPEKPVEALFQEAEIELLLAGWSAGNHLFELWTGSASGLIRKLSIIDFRDYQTIKIRAFLTAADIDLNGKLTFTLVPIGKGGHISVSYGQLNYPQDNPAVPNKKVLHIEGMQLVNFRQIQSNDFDYLIISHPLMHLPIQGINPLKEYAAYRSSKAGGSYKPLIMHSSEIFDQFNYGDPGPLGIRNMISWLGKLGNLKFVFLIGRSVDPQKARKLPDARQIDMVPNAGWPGSDIALAMDPKDSTQTFPIVPIGRLNALTSQNVYDYLLKVKAMEAEPAYASWRKNILHLSGGRSRDELSAFKGCVRSFEKKIAESSLGASVRTISKLTDDPVEQVAAHIPINEGMALITLFGHSSLDVTDIDIGYASDPKKMYANHPHYPAVIVNGCASGSIFYSNKTLSSDWIFTPKTGAVLFLAHTFNGVSTSLKRYTDIFYEVIGDSAFASQPFGNIQQEAIKRNMSRNPSIYDGVTIQQMNLHGDPAIRIFPATLPDYLPDSTSIGFFDSLGKELNTGSDSILVRLVVRNNGRFRKENYHLLVQRTTDSTVLDQQELALPAMAIADTMFFTFLNHPKITDQEVWKFVVDADNKLSEENELNNVAVIKPAEIKSQPFGPDLVPPVLIVTVDSRQLINNDVISAQPTIGIELFDVNISNSDTSSIVVWLRKNCQECEEKRIYLQNAVIKNLAPDHIYALINLPGKLENGSYLLTVQARDLYENYAPVYQIIFRVTDQNSIISVIVTPNPSDHWFKFSLTLDGSRPAEPMRFSVYKISGDEISKETVKLHPGLNEWVWHPKELPAGVYLYRIMLPQNGPYPGFEAEKALQGRLIWFR